MAKLNIYLKFDGNCEEAFKHYETVFGTTISFVSKYGDVPRLEEEGMPVIPEEDLEKIENICLPINKDTLLMGADGLEAFGMRPVAGNNFSIYVTAETQDEAYSIFNGLSQGGAVQMPLSRAHWGDYFGMCTDKFGISWFVNYSPKL
ncbi:VOC family protein [Bacteroides sp. 51]|uniref:VOC family protein n=1 Tax=Bacteroides sp. 51 TaxID=2302938 RepID=UPI0013D546F0|nr:VOC family protein [Bacteroides sp. 51]NDV84459.1 VOC family protein [Bacteroides sp. 51]